MQRGKTERWQLLPQKYRETERKNLPFSGSNSSRLSLVVQRELFAKDPVKVLIVADFSMPF